MYRERWEEGICITVVLFWNLCDIAARYEERNLKVLERERGGGIYNIIYRECELIQRLYEILIEKYR